MPYLTDEKRRYKDTRIGSGIVSFFLFFLKRGVIDIVLPLDSR